MHIFFKNIVTLLPLLFFLNIAFPQTDTLTNDFIVIKELNHNGITSKSYYKTTDTINPFNGFVIEYFKNPKPLPKSIKAIENGIICRETRYTYYSLGRIKEKYEIFTLDYSLGNRYSSYQRKHGKYIRYFPNGNIYFEGNYVSNSKNGIFNVYREDGKLKCQKKYYHNIKISQNYFNDTLTKKNYFSIDFPYLIIKALRISYERKIGKKELLRFEYCYKANYNTEKTTDGINFYYTDDNGHLPFFYFVPEMNLFLIGFSENGIRKNAIYVSNDIYFLKKKSNTVSIKYLGDGGYTGTTSEDSNTFGIRMIVGKKFFLGKKSNFINEFYDIYGGIGLSMVYTKNHVYRPKSYPPDDRSIYPTLHFGIRLGFGL